jgi:antitoxin component of RelBE/YafQ-DinJ toxin-antitoxin module
MMGKDAGLSVRIDAELLAAFNAACKAADVTASQVVRAAIREFLKDNAQPALPLTKGKGRK